MEKNVKEENTNFFLIFKLKIDIILTFFSVYFLIVENLKIKKPLQTGASL